MRNAALFLFSFLLFQSCIENKVEHENTSAWAEYLRLAALLNGDQIDQTSDIQFKRMDSMVALVEQYFPEKLPKTLALKALVHSTVGNFDTGRVYTAQVGEIIKGKAPDSVAAIHSFIRLVTFMREAKIDSALAIAPITYQLVSLYEPDRKVYTMEALAGLYGEVGDTNNVKKYIDEALSMDLTPGLKHSFNRYLAGYYERTGKADSAEMLFDRLLKDTAEIDLYSKAIDYTNLAHIKNRKGLYQESLAAQKKGLAIFRRIGAMNPILYRNLAEASANIGNMVLAQAYIDSAIELSVTMTNYDQAAEASQLASGYQTRQRNYRAANQYLTTAIENYRKADSMAYDAKVQEIETRLGVQLKDQQIENLDIARRAAVSSAKTRITIIIALIAGLILSGIVAFQIFRRQRLLRQLSEQKLELRVLRLQMEPHFIFNILSQAIVFIQEGLLEKATGYLFKFSRLLRLILINSRRPYAPLKDEIEALNDYIFLQQESLDGQFEAEMHVYSGYEEDEILVPPMIIQPFVENAINHGVRKLAGEGRIGIEITKETRFVRCVIRDNGPGLWSTANDSRGKSRSTHITRERLTLIHKQTGFPASLRVKEGKDGIYRGVIVELEIPFSYPSAQTEE